jgi:hypothetical protein
VSHIVSAAFDSYPLWARSALAVAVVLVIAYLAAEGLSRLAWRALRPLLGERGAGFGAAPLLGPVRLIRLAVFVLVTGALILPAMELAGVRTFVGLESRVVLAWLFGSGLRVGLILLLSYTILRITSLVVARVEQDVTEAAGTG